MEAQKPLEQETPETTPQEAPTATIPQPESTPAANMEADPIPEEMDASPESPAKKNAGKLAALIGGGIVIEYFGYGFGFVGLTMFMMHQIAPGKNQMSHYAIASGIMNLSVMVTGMSSGKLTTLLGYEGFFLFVLIFIIPALLITWFVPFTYPDKKQ